MPALARDDDVVLGLDDEMRRHDLHAVGVELILDVGVQRGEHRYPLEGLVHVREEFVFDVPVGESALIDEGLRQRAQARRLLGRGDEQRVHLPPGGIVADRHLGRHQRPARAGEARVVLDRIADEHGVGDRHFLVAHVDDLGRQRTDLADDADGFTEVDEVADRQRARVDEHETAHQLVDDAGRAERQHEAEHHRQPLERIAVGHRDERIGNGDAEAPDDDGADAVGGVDGLRMQTVHLHAPGPCRLEEAAEGVIEGLRQEEDDEGGGQRRDGFDEADADRFQQAEQEAGQAVAKRLGQREAREDEGQPEVGDAQPEKAHQQLRDPLHQRPAMPRPAEAARLGMRVDDLFEVTDDERGGAANQPQQQQRDGGRRQRQADTLDQHHRPALLADRQQCHLQFIGAAAGSRLERNLLLGVEVALDDTEEHRFTDVQADSPPILDGERRQFDRLLHLRRRQGFDARECAAHAILRAGADQGRAEGDDRPEVVVQGRFRRTLLAGSGKGSGQAGEEQAGDEPEEGEAGGQPAAERVRNHAEM
ncbi:MAG: hypothetical protein AW12_00730 [Candidatus Accumulibacter sp. BA-94]|nr:MAG: hypothetical protein AW12_00730 [Candidatus Accumulibacter sp. BA-94]